MFKRELKRKWLLHRQRGQILIYALLVMLLGSLMVAGTSTIVQSALKQGTISEDRTVHLYTADAGIESVWHNIAVGASGLPDTLDAGCDPSNSMNYTLNMTDSLSTTVDVWLIDEITDASKTYLARSVTASASGTTTRIESQLIALAGPYFYFLDNSFTTEKNIDFKNKISVNGWVQAGTHTGKVPIWGTGYGWKSGTPNVWPTSTELINYYTAEVNAGLAVSHSGGWSPSGTVSLAATQYVDGDFSLSHGTLNLNGYTLFVNGNVDIKSTDVNLDASSGCGCIVAIGNIKFWPNMNTGDSTRGVFIFSVGSTGAEFQPGNNFYGWIAAQNGVEVKSGNDPSYNWVNPPIVNGNVTLDFPGLNTTGGPDSIPWSVQITSWNVSY
jgi:hypothetical protein